MKVRNTESQGAETVSQEVDSRDEVRLSKGAICDF